MSRRGRQFVGDFTQYCEDRLRADCIYRRKVELRTPPGSFAILRVLAAQVATCERTPDQKTHSVCRCNRHYLEFYIAARQRIVHLIAHDMSPIGTGRYPDGPLEIACTEIAHANMADFSLRDEVVQHPKRLVERNKRVTVMQLEQVDVIATESLQTCLDRAHDV
ncbi:hypothetical protein D3C87_1583060 [compost metagenome]